MSLLIGGISALYLSHSADSEGALSGGTLSMASFAQVPIGLEDASFVSEGTPDGDGTSYATTIAFRDFDGGMPGGYAGGEVDALCVRASGEMLLFRRLSFAPSNVSGAKASEFAGTACRLAGVSWLPAEKVNALL